MSFDPHPSLSRRHFLILTGLAASAGVLQACLPASTPSPSQPAPAATAPAAGAGNAGPGVPNTTSGTINVWTGYPELEPLYKNVAQTFNQTYPKVSVEVLSSTLREMEQKLSTAVSAGQGPEVFDIGPNIIVKFIDGNLADPLPPDVDQYVKSGIYSKFTLDYLTYNGKLYGIPLLDGGRDGVYYNKAMFKEAGLDKPPATFDEMMDMAKKLVKTDASGNITRSGMSLRLSGQGSGIAEKFWFILRNYGGDPVVQAQDGTHWHNGYDNDAGRQTLQYYIDAVHKFHVDDQKVKHDAEAFETESTAMFIRESWVIGEVAQKNPKLDYSVAPMPKGPARWDTMAQPWGIYVNKTASDQALAYEFTKAATSKDAGLFQTKSSGWISPRQDIDWAALTREIPQYDVFVNPPKDIGFYAYPKFPAFDEILTKMADRLTNAYLDASLKDNPDGIAKTIKDMAAETDSILKQANLYAA
jgi:multiple sugar transport system substrate-binding protein